MAAPERCGPISQWREHSRDQTLQPDPQDRHRHPAVQVSQQYRGGATRWSETEHTSSLGDWPWGLEDAILKAPELDSSVGVIPTVRGEGLLHMPHGSDWSSIREAGMNAAQREPTPATLLGEIDRGTRRKGTLLSLC
jgi:hypothetical protein